jgi:acyl-CoA hydrolase
VEAMIQIADPKFRPALEDYAEKNKLLSHTAALA